MLSSICYASLRAAGISALVRRLRKGALILCYHNVVRPRHSASLGDPAIHLPLERLERQLAWVSAHYRVVQLGHLVERLRTGAPVQHLAAVTFDDGYMGVFRHAWPFLRDRGIPATVFLVAAAPHRRLPFWWDLPGGATDGSLERDAGLFAPSPLDARLGFDADVERCGARLPECRRPADWATIGAAVRAGLEVGVHSMTHRVLTQLSDRQLDMEISASQDVVWRATGTRPQLFAYPYGRWDRRVRDAVQAAGYRAAFTLDQGLNCRGADPWALRRVNVPATISDAAFQAWTAGLQPARRSRTLPPSAVAGVATSRDVHP